MLFLPAAQYNTIAYLSYIFLAILALDLLFLVLAVVFRRAVLGVENLLVYQFAYFCILGQKEVELSVASLGLFGRYSLGANVNIVGGGLTVGDVGLRGCVKMGKIYQTCNSLNNINVTFGLGIVSFLIAIGLTIHKTRKQNQILNLPNNSAMLSHRNSESVSPSDSSSSRNE